MHMERKIDTYEDEFEEFSAIALAFTRRGSLPLTSKHVTENPRRVPRRTKSLKTPKKREVQALSPLARTDSPLLADDGELSSSSSSSPGAGHMCTLRPPAPRYGNNTTQSRSAPSSRSGSWKKSHRASLGVVDVRQRTGSLTTEEVIDLCTQRCDTDICPVRSFKTSSKGLINRGDSVKYINIDTNTFASNVVMNNENGCHDLHTVRSNSVNSDGSFATVSDYEPPYSVLLLGKGGVGKTTLSRQFLTSEHIGNIDSIEDDSKKSVTVLLNGEEANVDIHDTWEDEDHTNYGDVDGYVVMYSITSRESYEFACDVVHQIRREEQRHCAIIVVANKGDLVRFREVTQDEAREMTSTYNCKYIEVSALLNIKVDELLVGLVHQIGLNPDRDERCRKQMVFRRKDSKVKSVQKLARGIIAKFFKNNGFGISKSCDNLMIL